MQELMTCYDALRDGRHISESECRNIKKIKTHSYQLASLAVLLLYKKKLNVHESDLLEWIFTRHRSFLNYLSLKFSSNRILNKKISENNKGRGEFSESNVNPIYKKILLSTGKYSSIGSNYIQILISDLITNKLSLDFLAIWLMVVCVDGMSEVDVVNLTDAMIQSGEIYDYRDNPRINKRKIIRRYPTGALSEKTALILPSLIASFAEEYPIATSFFVGKSLGFTGGTWDKLSSIPGFSFPSPGEETIKILQRTNAAMCITTDSLNPADRLMYQFRSVTGTINSIELIVASIASKQLASPPDFLLMDVRYGNGAFMQDLSRAKMLSSLLVRVIQKNGVKCISRLTNTSQPNGMAIGNSLEVAEATSIITGKINKDYWDIRALTEQRDLVINFLVIMLDYLFPGKNKLYWTKLANNKFNNGSVQNHYERLLEAHKVPKTIIENLCRDPNYLIKKIKTHSIKSANEGILIDVDQKKLGYILNFNFGAGGNIYSKDLNDKCGAILKKRIGDRVDNSTELCSVFDDFEILNRNVYKSIRECFHIK